MMAMSVSGRLQPTLTNLGKLNFSNGHAWLPFNIRAVVAVCSIPAIHCNGGRSTSA